MHVSPPDIVTTRQPNRSLSDVLKGAEKYKTEDVRELTHADDERKKLYSRPRSIILSYHGQITVDLSYNL